MGRFATAITNLFDNAGRRSGFRAQSPENPETSLSNPAEWLVSWMGGGSTYAGPAVNEMSAVRATAVFRCISLIANTIASLPLNVYKRTPTGREASPSHPLQRLLHDQPNPVTSSYTFRQIIAGGLLTNGNGYAVIGRNQAARIIDLMQIPALDVTPTRRGSNGTFRIDYDVRIDGQGFLVPQESMIHVPGFGFDGISGISPIAAVGRQAIGLGLALEEFQGRFTNSSARGSGVVEVDKGLSPTGLDNLRRAFDKLYSGLEKTGRTVFLDRGQTWKSMQVNPADAQTIETRKYQVADIARIFGVPLHLLGETEKATSWGTGIEEQTKAFVEYVIRPWLVSIEQEFTRKLFRNPYFCEFSLTGLLRGDSKARAAFYQSGINNAWLKPNEARKFENLPPVEGGDRLFINTASSPLDTIDERTIPATAPAPPAIPATTDDPDDPENKE